MVCLLGRKLLSVSCARFALVPVLAHALLGAVPATAAVLPSRLRGCVSVSKRFEHLHMSVAYLTRIIMVVLTIHRLANSIGTDTELSPEESMIFAALARCNADSNPNAHAWYVCVSVSVFVSVFVVCCFCARLSRWLLSCFYLLVTYDL